MGRLALLALIWGWSFLFIKVAGEGMTPTAVSAARIALGAAVMLLVLRARRASLPRSRELWFHFAFQGFVGSAIPFALLAWGGQHVSSALAAVLNASTPLFAAAIAALMLRERLRPSQLGGIALGFCGVGLAAGVGSSDLAGSSLLGAAAPVLAAACYGLSFSWARRYLSGVSPLVAATGQLVAGSALIGPIGIATTLREGISLTPTRIAAITILGALGTGVAYVLNYRIIRDVGPTRAAMVTQLVPIVAVTVGVVFLDEPFHVRLLFGGGLTLLGIALLHERLRRFRRVPAAV